MNSATYCPEDNKLRLYIGRVPRAEYETLRAEGWTALHKQREDGKGDFAAPWTPARVARALTYADAIEDEDAGPEERAADRAERFGEYREKRTGEAVTRADRYDAGPAAHGFQSEARAEKAAARHDRIADRAGDAWEKAEYWQRRTAGVISHALHLSSPGVRMGRIKTLEAELRKHRASLADYAELWAGLVKLQAIADPARQTEHVRAFLGARNLWSRFAHPRAAAHPNAYRRENKLSLYDLVTDEADPLTGAEALVLWFAHNVPPVTEDAWTRHFELRLAYENQMLEAQGGRAAFVEMIPGGWLGSRQIQKVNKSSVTGRVVSVLVRDNHASSVNHWGNPWPDGVAKILSHTIETERLSADAYRPPTADELAAFTAARKAEKAARPAKEPCPLVNPTDADAERLQAVLNARALADHCARHLKAYGRDYADQFKPSTLCAISQATYSASSGGSYARAETRGLCQGAELEPGASNLWSARAKAEADRRGPALCKVRVTQSDGSDYGAKRVIVLTDKPQKPFPAAVWQAAPVPAETAPELVPA
jgi:hypothetical protein